MIRKGIRSGLAVLATSALIVSCGGSDSDNNADVVTDSGIVDDGSNENDNTDGDVTDGDNTDDGMVDVDNDAPADTTNVVAIDISSVDGGSTLTGTMMYSSEGPVGFSGTLRAENSGSNLNTQIQFGGDDADFVPNGRWVIGSRDAQHVNELKVTSDDNGESLNGTMKYVGEGDIGITAVRQENLYVYDVDNTFNGVAVDGGAWVIGSRRDIEQGVIAVDIASEDGGENFTGTMQYSGEGPIGFRAERIAGNSYKAEIQFGGDTADFVDADYWIIGGRDGRAVALQVTSDDDGETLTGTMTYDFEGPIPFSAVRSGGDAYRVENQFNGSTGDGGLWILGSR